MICTTLQNKDRNALLEAIEGLEMAEIRLDKCELSLQDIEEVFSCDIPLVATCRIGGDISVQTAERRLIKAVEAGASFVDVEIEAPKQMSKRVKEVARDCGAVFIRSYHDWNGTDSLEALKALVDKCRYHGADMVKIVTTAKDDSDVDRVLSLYEEYEPYGLIAFCMGKEGERSRIECLAKGAPYSYACPDDGEQAAPGQIPTSKMREIIYGDWKESAGSFDVPCSKSFAQRAIIAAALAHGTSTLTHYSPCGDNESALELARRLGAQVIVEDDTVKITGASTQSLKETLAKGINVGESGLLCRLMIPLAAILCDEAVHIQGERTLPTRALKGASQIMEAFGAELTPDSPSEDGECHVPLTVKGPLRHGRVEISGAYGSQIISGLLMALPYLEKNTTLVVKDPKSIPYMFITIEVLKKFGIRIANDMLGGEDFFTSEGDWNLCTEIHFKVKGGQSLKAADIDLEGDWSSAAGFLVAGAIFGQAEVDNLDTASLQADLSIMDILMEAGASLSQSDGEQGTVHVQRAPLSAFRVDANQCPDLFPVISVLAAFCQGENHIAGIGRLSNKESDRGQAILEMLTQMGVEAGIMDDELIIIGKSLCQRLLTGELLKGGEYSSHHDHRMAMALAVASLGADSPIIIDDKQCVAKSFPTFFESFNQMMS